MANGRRGLVMRTPVASTDYLYSSLADDPDFEELLLLFVEEMPARLALLEQAFDASDWDMLRRLAHQLKGAGGSYGFDVVTQSAQRLEQSLLKSHPAAEIEAELGELIDLCRRLRGGSYSGSERKQ